MTATAKKQKPLKRHPSKLKRMSAYMILTLILGLFMGSLAGYFGGWVDNLIMRIVDIFYCIPSTPLIIILGAAMDGMRVDPQVRMLYLMLILGFLGWPGIARLVRGQILSLREQEFMTATEACGISVSRRIFRHLIPNVIPQLIVNCTMSLGSTILTEAPCLSWVWALSTRLHPGATSSTMSTTLML